MEIKDKQKLIGKWIREHGACSFDLSERNIILHDGGLFSIESKKVKRQRVLGYKKLPGGCSEVIFSKKKLLSVDHEGVMWFEDLDETIRYFQSMRRLLAKMGYKTSMGEKK